MQILGAQSIGIFALERTLFAIQHLENLIYQVHSKNLMLILILMFKMQELDSNALHVKQQIYDSNECFLQSITNIVQILCIQDTNTRPYR